MNDEHEQQLWDGLGGRGDEKSNDCDENAAKGDGKRMRRGVVGQAGGMHNGKAV